MVAMKLLERLNLSRRRVFVCIGGSVGHPTVRRIAALRAVLDALSRL
jgi:hypothetical protein